jgi:undecaprenyl diphosphate synthase
MDRLSDLADPGCLNNEQHQHPAQAVCEAVRAALLFSISFLTIHLSPFRLPMTPREDCALEILNQFIRENLPEVRARNVRIKIIGTPSDISSSEAKFLRESVEATARNTGMTLLLALEYEAREDIVAAIRSLARQVAEGRLDPAEVDANKIGMSLETAGIPDPDLIIRISRKQWLSNFFLWQSAYAEFVFLPINWRDFNKEAFDAAIGEYTRRERRFGGVTSRSAPSRQIAG